MAEFFNQDEIDSLLKTGLDDMVKDVEEPVKEEISSVETPKTKFVKPLKKKEFRFPSMYRSPVLKENEIVFNPENDESEIDGKVVVRTLENFMEMMRVKGKKIKNYSVNK